MYCDKKMQYKSCMSGIYIIQMIYYTHSMQTAQLVVDDEGLMTIIQWNE